MSRIDHDILVLFNDINDVKPYAQLFRDPQSVVAFAALAVTNCVGVPLHTKTGKEIEAFDVDTLILDNPGSEHRIEPA